MCKLSLYWSQGGICAPRWQKTFPAFTIALSADSDNLQTEKLMYFFFTIVIHIHKNHLQCDTLCEFMQMTVKVKITGLHFLSLFSLSPTASFQVTQFLPLNHHRCYLRLAPGLWRIVVLMQGSGKVLRMFPRFATLTFPSGLAGRLRAEPAHVQENITARASPYYACLFIRHTALFTIMNTWMDILDVKGKLCYIFCLCYKLFLHFFSQEGDNNEYGQASHLWKPQNPFYSFWESTTGLFYYPCFPLHFHLNLFFYFFIYWQKQQSHYSTTSPLPAMQPRVPVPNSVLSILLPPHRITAAQSQCFTSRSTHTSNCQRLSFLLSH